jgi:hypothetical protein
MKLLTALCAGIPLWALAPVFLFSLPQGAYVAFARLTPILSRLTLASPTASSALIVPRADINASLIPTTCLSACEPVLSVQSVSPSLRIHSLPFYRTESLIINGCFDFQKCGTDLKCRCTEANAHSFADCIDCAVGTQPDSLAQSVGQNVLSGEWSISNFNFEQSLM